MFRVQSDRHNGAANAAAQQNIWQHQRRELLPYSAAASRRD